MSSTPPSDTPSTAPEAISGDAGLHTLLVRADSGDAAACDRAYAELSRLIGLFVRRSIGRSGGKLRNHRESVDICQSIARSFVQDHRARTIHFGSEAQLVAYLKTVVGSKLAMLARSDNALKRGGTTRTSAFDEVAGSLETIRTGPSLSNQPESVPLASLQSREMMNIIETRLNDRDRELIRLRVDGSTWSQIAERLGEDEVLLRKRWSRLLNRLAAEE